jgi:hypothetical protein
VVRVRRASIIAAALLLVVGVAVGWASIGGREAAPAPAGNQPLYVSPSGSNGASCSKAAPCQSFDRVYHAARPGQTVVVLGGDYPDQEIAVDASKTSLKDVVLAPAAGAVVNVGQVTVYGSHLELRNMTFAGWETKDAAQDVTFRAIRAGSMYVTSSRDISVIGGSYGPDTDYDNGQIRAGCPTCAVPRNILIDGAVFHDAVITPGSDAHVECLQVGDVDGLTIRRSRFLNCETHSVFISPWWSNQVRNVTLENNFGGNVRSGYYGFRVAAGDAGQTCANVVFRYNSSETAFLTQCGEIQNVQMVANVGPYVQWACDTRVLYRRNVFEGAKCGPTDMNAPSDFVDPAAGDLHLKPGAAAIGRGDPKDYPALDIDGQLRPVVAATKKKKTTKVASRPDAGADQRR